ncbi:MAG: hypothetical protein AB7V27_02520 [Candidatus Binatia bacterium]
MSRTFCNWWRDIAACGLLLAITTPELGLAQGCPEALQLQAHGFSAEEIATALGASVGAVQECLSPRAVIAPAPMGPAGPPPLGAAGRAPIGAAGRAPIGAAGASPMGAAGPAPIGAAGPAPIGAAGPAPVGRASTAR